MQLFYLASYNGIVEVVLQSVDHADAPKLSMVLLSKFLDDNYTPSVCPMATCIAIAIGYSFVQQNLYLHNISNTTKRW